MAESEMDTSLEQTPTWAVATAVSMFVIASLLMERGLHKLGKYLKKRNQKPLQKALHKMMEELMLLGFISLLLTAFQGPVSNLCIPVRVSQRWLPCKLKESPKHAATPLSPAETESHARKLLMGFNLASNRRLLSTGGDRCASTGMAPFVSLEGLHQLHIFIFVLALVHVVYSCLTMVLGFVKMHHWKKWEVQTREPYYDTLTGLREALTTRKQDACTDRHSMRGQSPLLVWLRCFFGQFVGSVSKADYLTFRLAFISNHHLTNKFDFHDYVIRSMEFDFKIVVGISWWLWAFVVLFLLLNVHDWYTYFWMAFVPLILVLFVGTKQQKIISVLAAEARADALDNSLKEGPTPSKNDTTAPTVKTRDELFWFNFPGLLMFLIHFILFQNAFELAVFFWLLATFGWATCFFEKRGLIFARVIVGLLTQILCSYSTLPLYALVNQMGSGYKPTIFKKSVHSALHGWHGKAKKKQKEKTKPAEGSVLGAPNHVLHVAEGVTESHHGAPSPPTVTAYRTTAAQLAEVKQEQSTLPRGEQAAAAAAPTAPAVEPTAPSVAHLAAQEKFIRLYGKMKGTAKARDVASSASSRQAP